MPELANLQQVLEWLSKIAPERCYIPLGGCGTGQYCTVFANGRELVMGFEDGSYSTFDHAAAEYLIRELVEEKGWRWSLNKSFESWSAGIYYSNPYGALHCDAPTPLLALANAFRRAL